MHPQEDLLRGPRILDAQLVHHAVVGQLIGVPDVEPRREPGRLRLRVAVEDAVTVELDVAWIGLG